MQCLEVLQVIFFYLSKCTIKKHIRRNLWENFPTCLTIKKEQETTKVFFKTRLSQLLGRFMWRKSIKAHNIQASSATHNLLTSFASRQCSSHGFNYCHISNSYISYLYSYHLSQQLQYLLLFISPISCSLTHSLGHATFIALVILLYTAYPTIAKIFLAHVICSISSYHVLHVRCLAISYVRRHLFDIPIAPYASPRPRCHALNLQSLINFKCYILLIYMYHSAH